MGWRVEHGVVNHTGDTWEMDIDGVWCHPTFTPAEPYHPGCENHTSGALTTQAVRITPAEHLPHRLMDHTSGAVPADLELGMVGMIPSTPCGQMSPLLWSITPRERCRLDVCGVSDWRWRDAHKKLAPISVASSCPELRWMGGMQLCSG